MNKHLLLLTLAAGLTIGTNAQQKVDQYFRVTDSNFTVGFWQDSNNPNTINASKNSFTIPTAFGSVAWTFGSQNFWDPGIDMSGYDKLVIRLKSVVGNNLQFRIFDYDGANGKKTEYKMPDDIVEFDDEAEYEVNLKEDLNSTEGVALDKTNIKRFVFWNYWSTGQAIDENGNPVVDADGKAVADTLPGVTVTIGAMYLERTLATGEKDYVDLLADNKFKFSDAFLDTDSDATTKASYIDTANVLHNNENAYTGIYFETTPADWSAYKYLVLVPQTPAGDATPVVDYKLADVDDNEFASGRFRYGTWNRPRAAVQDLTAILKTPTGDTTDDAPTYLSAFNTKQIFSLSYSLWGGVNAWEYGVAGVYLSNTAPNYSTGFGDATDIVGDYVRDNAAENTISTVCLPYTSACCGAQVYEIAGVDSRTAPTELYAKPHAGLLEAGKPYILRSNSKRNITFYRAGANEQANPVQNGALMANAFPTYYVEADKNYCVLNSTGDTFEAVTSKSKRVNSNTAYVDFRSLNEAKEQAGGLVFSISGIDVAAGISTVNVERSAVKDNIIYDLSGCRVAQPTKKGIYIMNGKKFIVK